MEIKENYSLKNLNTFEIEASSRFFAEVENEADVSQALEFAKEKKLEIFVLGLGSNILISDSGFDGLVIHNKIFGIEIGQEGRIMAGAGEDWDGLVKKSVEMNFAGLECLSGVPGTVGASPVQNVGCYGQAVDKVITRVNAIDKNTSRTISFTNQECQFSYRDSIFKRTQGYIITEVEFQLTPNGQTTLVYHDLIDYFKSYKGVPTLQEVRKAIIEVRARKAYLIMPQFECYKTAGSFFKNPVVSQEQFASLRQKIKDTDTWFWEMPADKVKIAAAKLMEEAGFGKGYREGNVGISPKHSLSLVNFDKAKAVEVKALAEKIKNKVLEKYGVELEEEVLFVGKFN